ncbi:hypothetical protein ACHAWF_011139, partial [Thalassiosira exigua]
VKGLDHGDGNRPSCLPRLRRSRHRPLLGLLADCHKNRGARRPRQPPPTGGGRHLHSPPYQPSPEVMTGAPPPYSDRLLPFQCVEGTTTSARRRSRRPPRASPATPKHPSDGYRVTEEEEGEDSPSLAMSPRRLELCRCDDVHGRRDVHDVPAGNKPMESFAEPSQAERPSPSSPCKDVVSAVSQEEEPGVAVVSQDDGPAPSASGSSAGDLGSAPEPGRRREREPKAARRRSLRLRAKSSTKMDPDGVEPSLPNNHSSDEGTSSTSEEMPVDVEGEVHPASKPSSRSRRRSGRIEAKATTESPARKGKAKRRHEDPDASTSALPPPKRLDSGERGVPESASHENGDPLPREGASATLCISEKGHLTLIDSLEEIVFRVVLGPSSPFDNVSQRKKKRARRAAAASARSAPTPPEPANETASSDASAPKRRGKLKKRRDTFDLSKKRGLTASAKPVELKVLVDDEEEASKLVDDADYVTPKAGSAEVNVEAILSKNVSDEGGGVDDGDDDGDLVTDGVELSVMKDNIAALTSSAIQERMKQLFSENIVPILKYPCVSARIFAAMSIVYEDRESFDPLLPLLRSLVDAEIVSLKSKGENEVCFINKKVCFSGFDCSSTTTTVGLVVGQGGGDLRPSIHALEAVLQQARKLARPVHRLDVAVRCLRCMVACDEAAEACAATMALGYFPSARFAKATMHYLAELSDVKRYLLSSSARIGDGHLGVRYRLNDFIGRSVRFHLRELLNSIPECILDFDVDDCEDRWGSAVADRSISSILNFALERIHELTILHPGIFEFGESTVPKFFASEASSDVLALSRDGLRFLDKSACENVAIDISEARLFMFGARACKFVLRLLRANGVSEHIVDAGGWGQVEAIAGTFYKLNIFQGSENEHFVQLREVRDLVYVSCVMVHLSSLRVVFSRTVLLMRLCHVWH